MTVTRLQQRRGTAAEWLAGDPNNDAIVLASGEMGLETDTNKFKIGNGSTAWSDLAYQSLSNLVVDSGSALTLNLNGSGEKVLSLVTGSSGVQPGSTSLTNISSLTGSTAGLLKKTGSNTWEIDSSAYLTSNQTISVTGAATGSGTTSISLTLADSGVTASTYRSVTVNAKGLVTGGTNPTTLAGYGITDAQALDADLTAIAGITATSGLLKKTAANTWTLDTTSYQTSATILGTLGNLANASGYLKNNGSGTLSYDNTVLTSSSTSSAITKIGLATAGFVKTDLSGNLSSDTTNYLPTSTGSQFILSGSNIVLPVASQIVQIGQTTSPGVAQASGTYLVSASTIVAGTLTGNVTLRISSLPIPSIASGATGTITIGTVTAGTGIWTATITMTSIGSLAVGQQISATAGTGNLGTGLVTITATTTNTITVASTAAMTQGNITAILYSNPSTAYSSQVYIANSNVPHNINVQAIITVPASSTIAMYVASAVSANNTTIYSSTLAPISANSTILSAVKIG